MIYAEITGWGKCLPPSTLTNEDLATFMDASDEWITRRTGIKRRYISHCPVANLAIVAGDRALACAGIQASDIDLIVLATCSPSSIMPNTCTFVQEQLGAEGAAVFDLNVACSGFMYALSIATSMIQTGNIEKALIIGAEHLTWYIDWNLRDSAVLFGDGAGAAVLEASKEKRGVLGYALSNDASGKNCIRVHNFGTSMVKNGEQRVQFEGREIYKKAVPGMVEMARRAMDRAAVKLEDIDLVIPHQANIRIIEAVVKKLGCSMENTFVNVANIGNTSAASIPIALCDAIEAGRLQADATLLCPAFGAGLSSAAAVIQWGRRTTGLGTSRRELPACERSAFELAQDGVVPTTGR